MKQKNRLWALILPVVLLLALCLSVLAAMDDPGVSDVAKDAWYADAVNHVKEAGLMQGVTQTLFSPDSPLTRSMLVTILHREAGSPTPEHRPDFSDVEPGWYYDAVAWASENELVNGYGNGRFGPDDPVTREQLVTILWRHASGAAADNAEPFADQLAISEYAVSAVAWARQQGLVGGRDGNLFDPRASATRAEVATILTFLLQSAHQPAPAPTEPEQTPSNTEEPRVLIAYFSATGNTKTVAEHLARALDADLFEIVAQTPYTSDDLNYNNSSSRSSTEMNDPLSSPAISGSVENFETYDVVFLGYPIWFGQAPRIISTFLEQYDFSDKTIIPFCTSGSSGIGASADNLHALCPDTPTWIDGRRFGGSATQADVTQWATGLSLFSAS